MPRRRTWRVWWAAGAAFVVAALAADALLAHATAAPKPAAGIAGASLPFLDRAVRSLADHLQDIGWAPLLAALACALANGALRSLAWREIIAAAYPARVVRARDIFRATYAGIGLNAVLPARSGDVVRLYLAHRSVERSSYPTLAATLVPEALVDIVLGAGLAVWAWQAGYLDAGVGLPQLPLFEISWYARHPWAPAVVAGVVFVTLLYVAGHVRRFGQRVWAGFAILRSPARYLTRVVPLQLAGWCMRIASAFFFLRAFGIHAGLAGALLVQVGSSLGTLVPATPGGIGTEQALLVLLLGGTAAQDSLLAFSIGMRTALIFLNVTVCAACLASLGHTGTRELLRHARAHRATANATSAAGGGS